MSTPDHILVVDDDPEIRELLSDYLGAAGYHTHTAANGEEMMRIAEGCRIDLIVLDLMLPGEDGLTLCRNLRVRSNVPVIMLSARGALLDRIVGLEMGADDYLPKPFDPRELLSRIKVILRRARSMPVSGELDSAPILRFAGRRLDTHARQLHSPTGLVIGLGGSDYRVLHTLLRHPNRTLSRDFLVDRVYGKERSPFDRAIDVCVSRLRNHLEDDARSPQLIKTVRNIGYLLAADVMQEDN